MAASPCHRGRGCVRIRIRQACDGARSSPLWQGTVSVLVNGAFMGEGVMLPLKAGEFTVIPYAKEARVTVTKTSAMTTRPPHRTVYLDIDGNETTSGACGLVPACGTGDAAHNACRPPTYDPQPRPSRCGAHTTVCARPPTKW